MSVVIPPEVQVAEVALTCARCAAPLEFVERNCPRGEHRHVRCATCSPATFAACVILKVHAGPSAVLPSEEP
jgi:hypothetical protein